MFSKIRLDVIMSLIVIYSQNTKITSHTTIILQITGLCYRNYDILVFRVILFGSARRRKLVVVLVVSFIMFIKVEYLTWSLKCKLTKLKALIRRL